MFVSVENKTKKHNHIFNPTQNNANTKTVHNELKRQPKSVRDCSRVDRNEPKPAKTRSKPVVTGSRRSVVNT